jgi:uncharacterized damage-inducible protein DinB|uniref:DinB family protein n=1 Tax=Candidatus Planktophila sp. TaxID=2175601 RepID=UPI004049D991
MTISLQRALEHMAWANQEIYKLIAELPDEALDAYAIDPEFTVREILRHIATSAGGLASILEGEKNEVIEQPKNMVELREIAEKLAANDARLIKLVNLEDKLIEFQRRGETVTWMRSTVLTQAVHHSIEHRAQAVSALEARGYKAVNLDDFSVWDYELSQR